MSHPLRVYGESMLGADRRARLRFDDGTAAELPLHRYLGPADAIERRLLREIRGPVLDVGCGPGRLLHALAARGVFALGVDLSPVAVALATGAGGRAIVGSIFDELPGAGSWRSALLLDGNIGIGGAPERLLARIGALLCADGELLAELESPLVRTACTRARIECGRRASGWFRWARVSVGDIDAIAGAGGFTVAERWSEGGRWFARLVPRSQGR
jgi:SAM-dependent methyltransferase